MKQTIKTSRVAGQLEKMFRLLNNHFFDGALPEVVISLKKTVGAYGHFTCGKVWQAGDERRYEINISSPTLNRPIEETCATLLHEMCHLACAVGYGSKILDADGNPEPIKDTSNNGVYHNKRFKSMAEAHGLEVEKFNSQMQQLFAYIFVHFIAPQQGRQHPLFCWQPVITPILLHRLYHITPFLTIYLYFALFIYPSCRNAQFPQALPKYDLA